MAYLGITPKIGNIRKLDDVASQFNGVAVTFNLRVGGQVIQKEAINKLKCST